MSWVTGRPTTLADLVAVRPGLRSDWETMEAALWELQIPSPVTLELCRLRVAYLVGAPSELARRTPAARARGLAEERIERLPAWTTDPETSDEERASLAYAEQFTIDPHGLDDDDITGVRDVLGDDGLVALTVAVAVFEGTARAAAILDAAPAMGGAR